MYFGTLTKAILVASTFGAVLTNGANFYPRIVPRSPVPTTVTSTTYTSSKPTSTTKPISSTTSSSISINTLRTSTTTSTTTTSYSTTGYLTINACPNPSSTSALATTATPSSPGGNITWGEVTEVIVIAAYCSLVCELAVDALCCMVDPGTWPILAACISVELNTFCPCVNCFPKAAAVAHAHGKCLN